MTEDSFFKVLDRGDTDMNELENDEGLIFSNQQLDEAVNSYFEVSGPPQDPVQLSII